MTAGDWVVIPREGDLSRINDPLSGWSRLKLIERHNSPDTWTITGKPETMSVFTTDNGCILDQNGQQITSGSVDSIERGAAVDTQGRVVETTTVGFVEDLDEFGGRVVIPTPGFTLTESVSNFPDAYDLRTGAIEDLIIGYIRSHAGDLALASRRVPRLRIPASLGRGGTTQVSGRLDHLGILVSSLAEAGNLRIKVQHTEDFGGGWLDLVITAIEDRSNDIRFGPAGAVTAGIINEWRYFLSKPKTTRAIVAGGGELAARDFLQTTDPVAEALWGTIRETLVDQRQVDPTTTDKQKELLRGGKEDLEENAGTVSVGFSPILGPDLQYRRDVRVGDIVGYDLPGLDPAQDKIREATTVVTVEGGQPTEQVEIVVGTPDAPTTRSQQQTASALRAINVIQRSQ